MRIFLDTANIEHIRHAAGLGVISGVTTNPTLVAREKAGDLKAAILEICSIVPGPISVEALSLDADGMKQEAREIASWHKNVVVKIPISEAGLEALLGAIAGATYVSPFVGRLDDIGHHGMGVVADTVEIYSHYKLPTQVIAASLRHPLHTIEAAKAGAHIATIPYSMLMQMIRHPLTDIGIARFAEDWKKVAKQ